MYIPPSPMDLATVWAVKQWLGDTNGVSDANLQVCLTAASIYFLRSTGRGPRNWQNTTKNPFNQPVDYFETYDGVAGPKLWLRNFPINSVTSCNIGGVVIPTSNGPTMQGVAIDGQGKAIILYPGGTGSSPQTFAYVAGFGNGYQSGAGRLAAWRPWAAGPQQIQVSYNAGFTTNEVDGDLETIIPGWTAGTPVSTGDQISDGTWIQQATQSGDTGTVAPPWSASQGVPTPDGTTNWTNTGIPGTPNTIIIQSDQAVLSDLGVKYFSDGTPLTAVNISPAEGQYYLVAPGNYLFNAADAGKEVLLSYDVAGTPSDITFAVIQLVSLNYRRRDWIGMRSRMMNTVGSDSYTLDMDQSIKDVLEFYRRSSNSGN